MIKINAPSLGPLAERTRRPRSFQRLTTTLGLALALSLTQTAQAVDGVGLYDTTTGIFRLVESDGRPLRAFRIGRGTGRDKLPVAGNWDGARGLRAGGDTVGLYNPRNGKFKLRNSNFSGPADLVIRFGGRGRFGWTPLAGDWTGSGRDSIGLYDPRTSTFRLRKTLRNRSASQVFKFGDLGLGLIPIAGDWNQDGVDTVGLYDSINGLFFLTNSNREGRTDLFTLSVRDGPADVFTPTEFDRIANVFPVRGLDGSADVFPVSGRRIPPGAFDNFGREQEADNIVRFGEQGLGWRPIAGNWTLSFFDSVGLYDPFRNEFLLRFTNTSGPPDRVIRFLRRPNGRSQLPLAGDWRR